MEKIIRGTTVVAKYGYNKVLDKPFEFLYDFGYSTKIGCVVYVHGESNMQDSYGFEHNKIRVATQEDKENISWRS